MASQITNNELNALISLLDEPSRPAFNRIREKILFYGIDAIPYLEKAWDNSFDNDIQERIEEIIHSIQIDDLVADLRIWKEQAGQDLFKGFYLAAKYQYPDLVIDELKERTDKIERDIWLELNSNLTALEKIKVVNHILFDIYRFSGNKTNIDAPQNLFFNNLLETKRGNNLSLGILYIILSQKLGMPVYGVNLPQHFILAYADMDNKGKPKGDKPEDVLFYLNPFNKGAVFTQREIELFVKHLKIKPNAEFFKPCDNITILKRLFENIIYAYQKFGYPDKVNELSEIIKVLD